MGACCSSSHVHAGTYCNIEKMDRSRQAAREQSPLDELQELVPIAPQQLDAIIGGHKRVKPSPKCQLIHQSHSLTKSQTPRNFTDNEFLQAIKLLLSKKRLIELCDVSRHFFNICFEDIRIVNLGAGIQRHHNAELIHSTISFLHTVGFRYISKSMYI